MLRIALAGTLLWGVNAAAAELPDVGIVGLHQSGLDLDRQAELARELVGFIDSTGQARGLLPEQIAGTVRGRERILLEEGLLGPGRAKLDAAVGLYNQAQPEAALGLLGEALFELERAYPGVASIDDLWRAHLYMGSSKMQLGQEGAEDFAAAASLAPSRAPDAARFPPNVVEAYAAVQAAGAAVPTTLTITVTSAVPVIVDGIDRGKAPVTVEGMHPGVHHIVVEGPKGSRGYKRLLIPNPTPAAPGAPTGGEGSEGAAPFEGAKDPAAAEPVKMEVSVVLEEPFLGTPGPSRREREAQTASLYRALGTRASDVEYLLLGGVDGDSLHMQLYHAPSDTFSRSIAVPFTEWAGDEAVTTMPLLLNLIDKDGTLKATDDHVVPLDIGVNVGLASLLLDPPVPLPFGDTKSARGPKDGRKRGGLIVGIVAGAAVAGLAGGGVYFATRGGTGSGSTTTNPGTAESGTIIIDF